MSDQIRGQVRKRSSPLEKGLYHLGRQQQWATPHMLFLSHLPDPLYRYSVKVGRTLVLYGLCAQYTRRPSPRLRHKIRLAMQTLSRAV